MNYRSVSDLSDLTTRYASKVPEDVALIVGIPRSGMLIASLLALKLNLPLTDLYSFLRNDELYRGSTRNYKHQQLVKPWEAKKILLVDDSIASGRSMQKAVEQASAIYQGTVLTLAAFAQSNNRHQVDLFLEVVDQPRLFEWNILHHHFISCACLDIDGVLCVHPTPEENDDGPRYLHFLQHARPLFIPTIEVAHLVTSRLEKYRGPTEAWLARHGVRYRKLHMLDLPSAEERCRLSMHAPFKAQVYRSDPLAVLFVESKQNQAVEIMRLADKPVFCVETNQMYAPGMSLATLRVSTLRKGLSLKAKLFDKARKLLAKLSPTSPLRKIWARPAGRKHL